jgi:hypothetical protein
MNSGYGERTTMTVTSEALLRSDVSNIAHDWGDAQVTAYCTGCNRSVVLLWLRMIEVLVDTDAVDTMTPK